MDDEEALKHLGGWTELQGDGYPALADFIAQDPDDETHVFRKFKRLAVQNVLYLQGEMIKLEHDLNIWEKEVAAAAGTTRPELSYSMRSWSRLKENAQGESGTYERKREELARIMEVKLARYYKALMMQQNVARLEKPSHRVLTALRQWLHGATGVPSQSTRLDGEDKHMFGDSSDLVALGPPVDKDVLSGFTRDHWPFPTKTLASQQYNRTRYFRERRLKWLVTTMSIAIAATLLTCPILVLYFVTDPHTRLALVITFILLFALGLSLSTSANRDSIFAGTAAYSAVLVVFVSGNLANTN